MTNIMVKPHFGMGILNDIYMLAIINNNTLGMIMGMGISVPGSWIW